MLKHILLDPTHRHIDINRHQLVLKITKLSAIRIALVCLRIALMLIMELALFFLTKKFFILLLLLADPGCLGSFRIDHKSFWIRFHMSLFFVSKDKIRKVFFLIELFLHLHDSSAFGFVFLLIVFEYLKGVNLK